MKIVHHGLDDRRIILLNPGVHRPSYSDECVGIVLHIPEFEWNPGTRRSDIEHRLSRPHDEWAFSYDAVSAVVPNDARDKVRRHSLEGSIHEPRQRLRDRLYDNHDQGQSEEESG